MNIVWLLIKYFRYSFWFLFKKITRSVDFENSNITLTSIIGRIQVKWLYLQGNTYFQLEAI